MNKWIVSTVLFFSANALAEGGILLEPGITYQKSDGTIDWPSPFDDSSSEVKGLGASLRVGAHASDIIFVALDGRYGMPELKTSVFDSASKAKEWNYGSTVGVQTPIIGLRVWGTYIADAQIDPESVNNFDVKFQDGKGWRLGAGMRFLMVSVNLEYQDLKYEELELQNIGSVSFNSSTDNVTMKDKAWILGVSFPLAL